MTENGEIGMRAAIGLGFETSPRMNATVVENLIDRLVEEKWLLRVSRSILIFKVCNIFSYLLIYINIFIFSFFNFSFSYSLLDTSLVLNMHRNELVK